MERTAIQHNPEVEWNICWGCGPSNEHGLRIESYCEGEECVCTWQPQPHHNAGRPNGLNGGIIAALIDCHSMCAAWDAFAQRDGAFPDMGTVSLKVEYLAPTPTDAPLELRARIVELTNKKAVINCSLRSGGKETARGEVIGVRIPAPD
ncbi:MAG: PaaI family thioesterase [SAR324 cluster bacterium]|nr:PaaI family thioesterase [SAR324 cluster bacterium]